MAADRVDGGDMRGLVVPGAVLSPVGGRDLLPRVVEGFGVGKHLHLEICVLDGGKLADGPALVSRGILRWLTRWSVVGVGRVPITPLGTGDEGMADGSEVGFWLVTRGGAEWAEVSSQSRMWCLRWRAK